MLAIKIVALWAVCAAAAVAFLRRAFRRRSRSGTCESCGAPADVVLKDGSLWCWPCHSSALRLRYDRDLGRSL